MMLIADSGGSKTDWRLLHENGSVDKVIAPGFSPYNQPSTDLRESIEKNLLPSTSGTVHSVFFYGAGITSEENEQIVQSVLQDYFTEASIMIYSDLLGAARALCGEAPGIVCILGTGSNCCPYDGRDIYPKKPSLGWLLGDEGSGSHMGKRLVIDYLHGTMPDRTARLFHGAYPWDKNQFLRRLYHEERPAEFLGNLSRFLSRHIEDSYCNQLVRSCFEEFFEKYVMACAPYLSAGVFCTGSVAFYYGDLLKQVGEEMGLTIRRILQSPMDELVVYHQNPQAEAS